MGADRHQKGGFNPRLGGMLLRKFNIFMFVIRKISSEANTQGGSRQKDVREQRALDAQGRVPASCGGKGNRTDAPRRCGRPLQAQVGAVADKKRSAATTAVPRAERESDGRSAPQARLTMRARSVGKAGALRCVPGAAHGCEDGGAQQYNPTTTDSTKESAPP